MFACLHAPRGNPVALAFSFSPVVEQTSADTVVFSIEGLERLIGTPHQIASEIGRCGAAQGIFGSLAIAHNPDTAVLVARNKLGVTVIPPGREADALASLPIEALETDPAIIETFESWGIGTLAELAALPEMGLAARLGEEGVHLQRLALGRTDRALRTIGSVLTFTKRVELDHPIALLEPLLFVLSSILHELTEQMRRQSVATNRTELALELDDQSEHRRVLEFASSCRDPQTLLKLLQLDLEAHPPPKEIVAVRLDLRPAPPQVMQHGLFLPASPEPQKLQIVASRLAGLVGEGNVGAPSLLDTHRPDAFAIRPFHPTPVPPQKTSGTRLRLAFRVFRPAPKAEVRLKHEQPVEVRAPGVRGVVHKASGPWHSSGDWWTEARWSREEWDVDLSDGGLYRIYCRLDSRCWFVEGFYD
jgi:protein ImuB